jgi:hypothetical protein
LNFFSITLTLLTIVLGLIITDSLNTLAQGENQPNVISDLLKMNITGNDARYDIPIGNANEMTGSIALNTLAQGENQPNVTSDLLKMNITGNDARYDIPIGNANEMTGSIASRHFPVCYKSDEGYWCTMKP